jgi:hypothetical protein
MKGKSPKGVAWANVVRSTLYTSSQPAEPKWKFSFRDYIESRGETFQIKADFALAFRLFDNRELAKRIKDTAISDLSSFDTFHMRSSSKKAMKRIALLLDNELTSCWSNFDFDYKAERLPETQKKKLSSQILKFYRIKSPTRALKYAKRILNQNPNRHLFEPIVMHGVADIYIRKGMALNLAEPMFHNLKIQSEKMGLQDYSISSTYWVGYCLFIREKWVEAIGFLEGAVKQGFESPEILKLIESSKTKLNTKNS